MRSLKIFCVVGIVSLFFSCSSQDDNVTFFINNELNSSLTINGSGNELNSRVFKNTSLDLTSSESYEKYIRRLTDVQITKLNCSFQNYQGSITNGKIYIDNILLGDFNSNDQMDITNETILNLISNRFLEKTVLDFYFIGESDTRHHLTVNVELEIKGTFVH